MSHCHHFTHSPGEFFLQSLGLFLGLFQGLSRLVSKSKVHVLLYVSTKYLVDLSYMFYEEIMEKILNFIFDIHQRMIYYLDLTMD